jgi:hypothetical protein
MGHSRTPTQNTAGDGFAADPVDGYVRASIKASRTSPQLAGLSVRRPKTCRNTGRVCNAQPARPT